MDLFETHNYPAGIVKVFLQRGTNYYDRGKYDSALNDLEKAYEVAVKLGNKRLIADVNTMLGATYLENKNYLEARKNLNKGLDFYKEGKATGKFPFIYQRLSILDSLEGNYQSALTNHHLYVKYQSDLRLSQKETENIAMRYEFEKEQAVAAADLKNRNLQRNVAIAGLIISILSLMALIYFLRLRNKKIKVEKENIELSKREVNRIIEAEQFKSRFLANISHEFRTPLTLINGHLEVLEENGREEDISRFHEMKNNSKQLLQLINQLLELSKMESTTYKLKYHSGNILKNAKALVESFHSLAEQKKITLEFKENATEIEHFVYSQEALSVILSNLLSNAFKFTSEGGQITVNADLQNNVLFLKVSDTGVGIAPEHVPTIFDRFYQVDEPSNRTYEGSGIGLALVKELTLLHGGSVALETREEGGCIFTVTLKSADEEIVSEEVSQDTPLFIKNVDSTSIDLVENELPLILVVEDQSELRRFIVENLGDNYRFAEAKNGKEGIKLAGELVPDLIISDIMMPDTDGLTLCKTLKENIETSHIPIVLLTAKADQTDKLTGLEMGADDYLTKPFSLAEIKLRIRNIMRTKERLRKKFEGYSLPTTDELPISEKDREFIEKLNSTVFQNLSNREFGAQELSDSLFFSMSKLSRKMKNLTGKTPAEYIRNIRLQKAVELLKKGKNVNEAGWEVGFEDSIYFSKVFKKQFGYAPSSVKSVNQHF